MVPKAFLILWVLFLVTAMAIPFMKSESQPQATVNDTSSDAAGLNSSQTTVNDTSTDASQNSSFPRPPSSPLPWSCYYRRLYPSLGCKLPVLRKLLIRSIHIFHLYSYF